jgi:hypothetical protein
MIQIEAMLIKVLNKMMYSVLKSISPLQVLGDFHIVDQKSDYWNIQNINCIKVVFVVGGELNINHIEILRAVQATYCLINVMSWK